MYHFGPLGSRSWDNVRSARGLLGVHVCEDKRGKGRTEQGKTSDWNADLKKSWPMEQGALKQDLPIGVLHWAEMANVNVPVMLSHWLGAPWSEWDLGSKDEANLAGDYQLTELLADKQQVLSWKEFRKIELLIAIE